MLYSSKIRVFVLISICVHIVFALLFREVTLHLPPPTKDLSLVLLSREAGKIETPRSAAAWPMPKRYEPSFPVNEALENLDADLMQWAQYGLPEASRFSPKETLTPGIDVAQAAEKAYPGPKQDLFSPLPAESKSMPTTDFALNLSAPGIFRGD